MKKIIANIIVCAIMFSLYMPLQAQIKRTNNWYFGKYAGMNFNAGYPQILTDGQVNAAAGGSAVMSDTNGNLLFYSDGESVWNRNHDVMPNGYGLLGLNGSKQSSLIVPMPGNDSLYYLFTTDGINSALMYGLRYSIINMNLDNGLGDVTSTKNIKLLQPVSQKISAVKHANGNDIWLVTHHWGSDTFYSYKITNTGISSPVLSKSGTYHTGPFSNSTGYLKISHKGEKIVVTTHQKGYLEVFDFDNSTGIVSNQIQINLPYVGGAEFSPDDSKLYFNDYIKKNTYQLDLEAGSDSAIIKSLTKIGSSNKSVDAMQLASDGRIYVSETFTEYYLDVILFPDSAGLDCSYKKDYVYLNGKSSYFGFPNFFQSYFENMSIPVTPKISGKVKFNPGNNNFGKVYLYRKYSSTSRKFDSTTFDTTNGGYFEFPYMNDFEYKLLAKLDKSSPDYLLYHPTYYGDADNIDSASSFTSPGNNYDIKLIPKTMTIKGYVKGDHNYQGTVYLLEEASAGNFVIKDSNYCTYLTPFEFSGIAQANYTLLAKHDPSAVHFNFYLPTYYGDVTDINAAGIISNTKTDVIINLVQLKKIGGKVRAGNHDHGMVFLYELDSLNNYLLKDSFSFDTGGYYEFNFTPANFLTYAILDVNSPNYIDYAPSYYKDVVNWNHATIINSIGTSYDIYMYRVNTPAAGPGRISGRTVKMVRSTNGLENGPNILVLLKDGGNNVMASQFSDVNGEFEFTNLPYGSYRVYVELIGVEMHDLAIEINEENTIYSGINIQINSASSSIYETEQNNLSILGLPVPNPFYNSLFLQLKVFNSSEIDLEIKNILGQQVYHDREIYMAGSHTISLNTTDLNKGIYILSLRNKSTGALIHSFNLVKN